MSLPSFLEPLPRWSKTTTTYFDAVFHHQKLTTSSHSQWWPSKQAESPETVIFFIPGVYLAILHKILHCLYSDDIDFESSSGNPGLLDFYTPFLSAIHEKDTTSKLAIFCHSHIGHDPNIAHERLPLYHTLTAQTESILEAFDVIYNMYGATAKIVVIGHSVGSWLALQVPFLVPYVSHFQLHSAHTGS
jgi:hypothetical protein